MSKVKAPRVIDVEAYWSADAGPASPSGRQAPIPQVVHAVPPQETQAEQAPMPEEPGPQASSSASVTWLPIDGATLMAQQSEALARAQRELLSAAMTPIESPEFNRSVDEMMRKNLEVMEANFNAVHELLSTAVTQPTTIEIKIEA